MVDFLKDLLNEKTLKFNELMTRSEKSEDVEEVKRCGEDMKTLKAEMDKIQEQINKNNKNERSFNFMNTILTNQKTAEERAKEQSFMNYVQKGIMAEDLEQRDGGVVVPTTLINSIITKLEKYGNVYNLVSKTNLKGGVSYPTISVLPTATWGATPSTAQSITPANNIVFSYYSVEVKVSQSLLENITSIDAFNAEFENLSVKAIVKAIDNAIVNGTGSGQPLGIAQDTTVTNVYEIEDLTYGNLKSFFSKLNRNYRANACLLVAQETFDSCDSLTDNNGQPIAKSTYALDGAEINRLFGKKVETVETSILSSFDEADDKEVIGIYGDFSFYAINTNAQLNVVKWVDNDTNKVYTKAYMVVDGKVLDSNAFVLLKKKVATPGA